MAIGTQPVTVTASSIASPAALSASNIIVNLTTDLKPLPEFESLKFGEAKTDHMLVVAYDPVTGWGTPEIKPYGPLPIDPMASCLHYCPNVFEGMKAYVGSDGKARLFRPKENMARFVRSAARVALPTFDPEVVLTLIQRLVEVEKRWIPSQPGYSLYVRPTIVGTRDALGVAPSSDSAVMFILVSPTGPYFPGVVKGISLLAVGETVRAWPGGTGGYKLGLNYAPTFLPQKMAAKQGYDQVLWLLGDDDKVTEVGAMNVFVAAQRADGDVDLITPALDGTILPGVTRGSTILLAQAHTAGKVTLPGVPASTKLHVHERSITMAEVAQISDEGRLLESFGVGTAVIVAPIGRIGWKGRDLVLPEHEGGLGPIGKGFWTLLGDIQTGKVEFEDWSLTVA